MVSTEEPNFGPRRVTAPGPVVNALPEVTAYIASLNTARATELCIRSMREFAGMPFGLVVGDCGSTDGSLRMLEGFAALGWLSLEVAPNGRRHPEWLQRWLDTSPTRYVLFSDSDVEYREPNWLADMVDTATKTGAALVCGRMQQGSDCFVHPVTKAERRLAARPTAWLLMIDTLQVRDRVEGNFEYHEVEDFNAFGSRVAYDTGAWYFKNLCDEGLQWVEMPPAWQSKYRHFGGLTWLGPTRSGAKLRIRARQAAKLVLVFQHLRAARRQHWGETQPSTIAPLGAARPAS